MIDKIQEEGLDVSAYAMTKAESEAIRNQNLEKYAASGMVHMGKHQSGGGYTPINEGLASRSNSSSWANSLAVGGLSGGNLNGTSKTEFPVSHIAGVITELLSVNFDNPYVASKFKFPEAPDGTVTYDSATGKVTQHASAAEAFDYETTNSNFRDGTTGWNTATVSVNKGLATIVGNNARVQTVGAQFDLIVGEQYTVDIVITEARGGSIRYTTDSLAHQALIAGDVGLNTATFTATDTNYFFWCVNTDLDVSYISVRKATEEVVTDRYDMYGFEQYLRKITSVDPFVYPNGLPQNKSTRMDGIATVDDRIRPITYFAVFDGDTTSRGKGVNWSTATDAQKIAILSNPKNNIYYDPDTESYYQWCIRQRTVAGAGNGDWFNTGTIGTEGLQFQRYPNALYIDAQGTVDTVRTFTSGYSNSGHVYTSDNTSWSTGAAKPNSKGVFKASSQVSTHTDRAVNGECYFLVLGTVARLNQGAYHPSFNQNGSGMFVTIPQTGWVPWYSSSAKHFNSRVDLFTHYNDGGVNGAPQIGSIAYPTQAGRPDKRFYNAIYAGGQGGVNDDRLSAWGGSSPEEAAKVEAKVENGTYRGEEKLVYTRVYPSKGAMTNTGANLYGTTGLLPELTKGDIGVYKYPTKAFAVTSTGLVLGGVKSVIDNGANTYIQFLENIPVVSASEINLVWSESTNQTVSGEFSQMDVMGDPSDILSTNDLKGGWPGGWIPPNPRGKVGPYTLTRKGSNLSGTSTSNSGVTWSNISGLTLDKVTNSTNWNPPVSNVVAIFNYTAFAKQTKESTNKPVLNGKKGVMPVFVGSYWGAAYGALLAESTLGIMLKDSGGFNRQDLPLLDMTIFSSDGKLVIHGSYIGKIHKHNPVLLAAPSNNSPACKVLPYQISNNGQVSLGFMANELTWDSVPVQTANGSIAQTFVQGTNYAITSGKHTGRIIHCNLGVTTTLDSYYIGNDGHIYNGNGVLLVQLHVYKGAAEGWGDDNTIKVTNSGSDTFVDLNGNTNLSVVHELSKPYGWTHNHARVGTQVEGVDL